MIVAVVVAVALVMFALRGQARDAYVRASGTVEHVTRIGERRTIHLDDGTRVELGVASTLRHPAPFPPQTRPVTVIGEAFFAVTKDDRRPFIVTAGPAAIETMGARFGVRAYPGLNTARVVVDSGGVDVRRVNAEGSPTTALGAGQGARIARDGAINRSDSVNLAALLGWRTG